MKVLICGFLTIGNIQAEVIEFLIGISWSQLLHFLEIWSTAVLSLRNTTQLVEF